MCSTIINKKIIEKKLSMKALGVYLIIKVLNDNKTKITIDAIKELTSDGTTAIRSGINELIEKEIITRKCKRGANGGFGGYEYKIMI